mgnify:CR=1 FL=1
MSHKITLNKYNHILQSQNNTKNIINYGEVITPFYIIYDMVKMLPKTIWKNPQIKILDPAAGDGRFSLYCYELLMKNLSHIKNKTARSKHIIQNCLYMCDINKNNTNKIVKLWEKINPHIKPNVFNADFLKWEFTITFDIILGNPPYNKSGGVGRVKGGSKQPIWHKFIEKSVTLLNKKGYINFIHPVGWRKYYDINDNDNIGHVLYNYNQSGSIISLKMNNIKYGESWPIVDYYLYQKDVNKSSKIVSVFNDTTYNSNLDLHNLNFIPSIYNNDILNIINKLFKKNNNDKLNIKYHGWMQPNKSMLNKTKKKNDIEYAFYYDNKLNKYHLIYENTISKIKKNKSIKNKKTRIERLNDSTKSSKIIMTFHGSKKIGHLHAGVFKGPIGTTTYTMYLNENKKYNNNMFVNFLNSKVIVFLLKLTQYSPPPRNKNEWKILNNIYIPHLSNNPTDNDIYKYYHFNKKEISLIEHIVTNTKTKKHKSKSKTKSHRINR